MKILFCTNDKYTISLFPIIESYESSKTYSIDNIDDLKTTYQKGSFEIIFIDYNLGINGKIEEFIMENDPKQKIVLSNYPIEFLFKNCCTYKTYNNFRSISTLHNISKIMNIIVNFDKIECSDNKLTLLQDYIESTFIYFGLVFDTKIISLKDKSNNTSIYTTEYIRLISLLDLLSIDYKIISEMEIEITQI